jgi:hypothetical protein
LFRVRLAGHLFAGKWVIHNLAAEAGGYASLADEDFMVRAWPGPTRLAGDWSPLAVASSRKLDAIWNPFLQEGLSVLVIAKVHPKMLPLTFTH